MLYLTKDSGSGFGAVIAEISEKCGVENLDIRMDMETITATMKLSPSKEDKTGRKVSRTENTTKTEKKQKRIRRFKSTDIIQYNGKSLTIPEWAKFYGVTPDAIKLRIISHGNPAGQSKPTDSDKAIASVR